MAAQPDSGVPKDHRPSLKVILVGPTNVGKTSLLATYLKQPFQTKSKPTVAPAHVTCPVTRQDGLVVILQIWDTAGQERYASISQLFFRDSDVALVCFSPCDEVSPDEVTNWITRISDEVPGCHLIGVMTKSDKYEETELQTKFEEAKQGLASHDFKQFFITSALKRDTVEPVFRAAADLFTKKGSLVEAVQANPKDGKDCC
jgi:small GTP-binding protein